MSVYELDVHKSKYQNELIYQGYFTSYQKVQYQIKEITKETEDISEYEIISNDIVNYLSKQQIEEGIIYDIGTGQTIHPVRIFQLKII